MEIREILEQIDVFVYKFYAYYLATNYINHVFREKISFGCLKQS